MALKVTYSFSGVDVGDINEKWPGKFLFPPVVGDGVISESGRRLFIQAINHYHNGFEIVLGKQSISSDSPMGGGGITEIGID